MNHRWRSPLLLLMNSAGLFENWRTARNICFVNSGHLKWKAECYLWCVVTGKRHFKSGYFKSPFYREYQWQVFDTQSEVMEIHHRPGYMKPTQTCASFCTDKQVLQIDEGAIWRWATLGNGHGENIFRVQVEEQPFFETHPLFHPTVLKIFESAVEKFSKPQNSTNIRFPEPWIS